MNKYGIVVFKNTQNIGDDIQSYAAYKKLPKVDYFIERECLNEFISNDGEIVNTLMSGWYLHDITSLPPSPFINPLFISTHFTDHLLNECPEYLSGEFIKYLKNYEPIGCRDEVARKYLTENKIDNYWSGCITLTIDPFKNVKKEDYICAVDLTKDEIAYLKKITKKEIKIVTHSLDDKINSKLSYEKRMENVEKLLKQYQASQLVVTSRLHSLLPSIALNTPVLLIYDENNLDKKNRMGYFLNICNHTSKKDFLRGKWNEYLKNPTENPKDYLKLKENIEKTINDFIENKTISYKENKLNKELYSEYFIKNKKYLIDILNKKNELEQKAINEQHNEIIKQYNLEISELNRTINRLQLRDEVHTKELEETFNNYSNLTKELNSRGYKLLLKVRKIIRFIKRRGK